MLVIGLTGGIGSGKSTVAKLFAEKGIAVIDADELAHEMTARGAPALKQIAAEFGHDILLTDGTLDRSKLRTLVFADDAKRQWLEQLLHPLIRKAMARQIAASSSPYCIVVIPLLFETTPNPLIERILVVDTPEEQQIARTVDRDKTSAEEVRTILKTQVNREMRLSLANDVIHNEGLLGELPPQVNKLHEIYLTAAKKNNNF